MAVVNRMTATRIFLSRLSRVRPVVRPSSNQFADPLERVIVAGRADVPLSEADLSSLVLEAVASQPIRELRAALSLVLYLKLRSSKKIAATAAETLASQIIRVLQPAVTTHEVFGRQATQCREVAVICSTLTATTCDRYPRNLLQGFLPDGFSDVTPALVQSRFSELWDRFGLERNSLPAAASR